MELAGRKPALEEPVTEQSAERPEAKPDIDTTSLASDCECPVCYQTFCEPVLAGCGRHTFCRNCLLRSQRCGSTPKCPICRCESQDDAADLPEVASLVDKLKKRDPGYEGRVIASRKEREEHLQYRSLRVLASAQEAWNSRTFEVCGAGCEDANGSYVAGILPTYVGPTVYRKPNTYLFIYRWHQTQWVIAELRGPYSMGNESDWLYCAPTQPPNDFPPVSGWEVQVRGRAIAPAPLVRPPRAGSTPSSHVVRQRTQPRIPGSVDVVVSTHADETWTANNMEDGQVRCRCAPSCSVM